MTDKFDVKMRSMIVELQSVIKEIRRLNPMRNDLDAYLYHLCDYALGETDDKPERRYYGLPE